MDILQPLNREHWPLLRDTLKRDWPIYGYCYNWVKNTIELKDKNPSLPIEIYCPYGKYDSGLFIGVSEVYLCCIFMCAFDECKELLRKALNETSVINWSKNIFFEAVHQRIQPILLEVLKEKQEDKNFDLDFITLTNYYFKSKEECEKHVVNIPEECELKNLELCHIPLIHSVWPHRSEEDPESTTGYLRALLTVREGLGLFLKKDNSLVSWIMVNNIGGLGMLQTLKEHQGKGYGKVMTQAMSKMMADKFDYDSVLFITEGNTPSLKIFQSLNYKTFASAAFIATKQKVRSSS